MTFEGRSITTHMSAQRSIRSVILWTLKKNKASVTQANLYGAFPSGQDGEELVQIPAEVTLKRYLAQLEKSLKSSHQQPPSTSTSSSSSSSLSIGTIAVAVRKKQPGDEGNFMKVSGKVTNSSRSREIIARIGDFFSIKKSTRLDRAPNGRTLKKLFGSPSGMQNEFSKISYERRCDWLAEDLENIRPRNLYFKDDSISIGSTRDGSCSSGRERMSCCASGNDSAALPFRQLCPEMTSYWCHNRWISNCDLHQKHSLATHHRRRSSECFRQNHASHPDVLHRGTPDETAKSFRDESNVSIANKSHSNVRLSMGVSQRILRSRQNLSLQENSKTLNQSILLHKTAKKKGDTLLFEASTPSNVNRTKSLSAQKTTTAESDTSSIWTSPPPNLEGTFHTPMEADLSAVNDVSDAESDSVFQVTGTSIEADLSLQNTPVTPKSEFSLPPLKMRRKRFFTDLTD